MLQKIFALKTSMNFMQATSLIKNLFLLYEKYGISLTTPSRSDLQKCFHENLQVISNDFKACTSLDEFLERVKQIQSSYQKMEYSPILEDPIIDGNKFVIRYNIDLLDKNNQESQFKVMAIITVDEGKITKWTEVLHEKGTGQWDL